MKQLAIITLTFFAIACGPASNDSGSENKTKNDMPARAELPLNENDTITIVGTGATMNEMKYDTKVLRVPANKEITIELVNQSTDASMPHNLVVIQKGTADDVGQGGLQYKENNYVNPDDENVIANTPVAQMGETVYVTFTTPAAGDYDFICSYPGHWGLMNGRFVTR